uniref:Transposase n=1 Tax=Haemonchus contortus TaxID=6289 RepID=A0A7I5ECR8_HAECO
MLLSPEEECLLLQRAHTHEHEKLRIKRL